MVVLLLEIIVTTPPINRWAVGKLNTTRAPSGHSPCGIQKKIMIQKTPSLSQIPNAADMSASPLLTRLAQPTKMPEHPPKIRKFIDFFEEKDTADSLVSEGRLPTQTIKAP